mmetsp:Transcript_37726/g.78296  ORF Transcript_37726/g.78296 Transcript_37726/m.78296 type:complete len:120 (+) Transcript_37726:134-493(+)
MPPLCLFSRAHSSRRATPSPKELHIELNHRAGQSYLYTTRVLISFSDVGCCSAPHILHVKTSREITESGDVRDDALSMLSFWGAMQSQPDRNSNTASKWRREMRRAPDMAGAATLSSDG